MPQLLGCYKSALHALPIMRTFLDAFRMLAQNRYRLRFFLLQDAECTLHRVCALLAHSGSRYRPAADGVARKLIDIRL
jgi:hypothetical protein